MGGDITGERKRWKQGAVEGLVLAARPGRSQNGKGTEMGKTVASHLLSEIRRKHIG